MKALVHAFRRRRNIANILYVFLMSRSKYYVIQWRELFMQKTVQYSVKLYDITALECYALI